MWLPMLLDHTARFAFTSDLPAASSFFVTPEMYIIYVVV